MNNDNALMWIIGAGLVLYLISNKSTATTGTSFVSSTANVPRQGATSMCSCFGASSPGSGWCC